MSFVGIPKIKVQSLKEVSLFIFNPFSTKYFTKLIFTLK